MSKFSVEWASPTCKRSTCADPIDYWYLNAKVRRAGKAKFELVCSSKYGLGYYTREEVDSAPARAAFLQKLTPTPRGKGKKASSSSSAVKVSTSTGREGALTFGALQDFAGEGAASSTGVRKLNREMARLDQELPSPLATKRAASEQPSNGQKRSHHGAEEAASKQDDAEVTKHRKEELQDMMLTGHAGSLIEPDEHGNDRHLDDFSNADARDMVVRAAGLQFYLLHGK
jgi:hypothetical protein